MCLLSNCHQMNATGPSWWWVNIGSTNGLVPSGNKPLPEPMLTQIYAANGVTRPQWVEISLAHLNSDFNYFSYTLQSGLAISSGPRKKEISMEKNAPEETGFFHPYQKKWNKLKLVEYIYFCILIIFPERKLSLIFSLNRKKCHLQKFIIWFIIYTLPFQWFFLEKLKNCHYRQCHNRI